MTGDRLAVPTFESLVDRIERIHADAAQVAGRAINRALTLRNWWIGLWIAEYELNGADRAEYGEALIDRLSARLIAAGVSRAEPREHWRYRRFYRTYPDILETVSPESRSRTGVETASAILETLSPESQSANAKCLTTAMLIGRLSFSHFIELIAIDDPGKRAFYEHASVQGGWTVRELKRQIGSLYYERTALSTDRSKLVELTEQGTEKARRALDIRDPYTFEFLGLRSAEVMSESHLEDQLLDKLREFLLELGHGFCFEARQKRIAIGDNHNFVDLVFYHRILKCHVLVELKVAAFNHEHIGQLNTYVSWYRANMMSPGDSPPIGILLCTKKDHALVEYALAGMNNDLFVSKYQLELPTKETIEEFLTTQLETERESGNSGLVS